MLVSGLHHAGFMLPSHFISPLREVPLLLTLLFWPCSFSLPVFSTKQAVKTRCSHFPLVPRVLLQVLQLFLSSAPLRPSYGAKAQVLHESVYCFHLSKRNDKTSMIVVFWHVEARHGNRPSVFAGLQRIDPCPGVSARLMGSNGVSDDDTDGRSQLNTPEYAFLLWFCVLNKRPCTIAIRFTLKLTET